MEMFDEQIETKIASDGTVTVKLVSDEETIREMELQEACEELVEAEREFAEWDAKAGKRWAHPDSDPASLCQWFDSLERRHRADKRLWELFVGADRSVRSNCLYNSFRRMLLSGGKLRANA